MQLSQQFGTGITPYDLPAQRSVAPSLPKLNIRLPDDGGDPDPSEPKTGGGNESPASKGISMPQSHGVSNPKVTGQGRNIWGNLGKDLGYGAAGLATVGGAGYKLAKSLGGDAASAGEDIGIGSEDGLERAIGEVPSELPALGRQFASIGSRIGTGAASGAEELAPVAAATEAIGGGPEDPIADIGAGAEEVGGALGGVLASFL